MNKEEREFSKEIVNESIKDALLKGQLELKQEIKDLETANESWKKEQEKNVKEIKMLTGHIAYLHEKYVKEKAVLKNELEIVDNAADYWKSNFETMFNNIIDAINLDGETYSDGDVVDIIADELKKYQGESDELKTIE